MDPETHAENACALVAGMDIHPVAAIIARVTYLLALGEALQTRRGDISIPVYLGDAMQLSVSGMMAGRELVIQVPAPDTANSNGPAKNGNGQREMLRFPEAVCRDPHLLDSVVERMRLDSENNKRPEAFGAAVKGLRVPEADLEELIDTYRRYDDLRKADRNTIWSYVARNLSRPLYLSAEERRADVLVGNPPWPALRHMSDDLHKRFKGLAKGEGIYVGGNLATDSIWVGRFQTMPWLPNIMPSMRHAR